MRQAQIQAWGETPRLINKPALPPPTPDEVQIKILAVGIHRVVRSRARGSHYSASILPHTPGIDGVGTTEDGQKIYFVSLAVGTLAEYINIPKTSVYRLPADVDPVQVAASINPAMSSWMSFKARTTNLPEKFTVLILGAASASGRVAISLARALGAKTVIGAARSQEALSTLDLDRSITITPQPDQTNFSNLDDVDVVLDYVFGPLTIHLFNSLKTPKPVQYVHIGGLSATEMTIPGEVLRSKDITIRGSGPGSWSMKAFAQTLPELLKTVPGMPAQQLEVAKFEDLEVMWEYAGPKRLVFVP